MTANGLNGSGVSMFQQGQYHAAIEHFQQARANDPRNADAVYNLAATYHRMGKLNSDQATLAQAENLYNQCLDLSPDHVDCHRGLAVLLVETERSDKAFKLLEGWNRRSPHAADARIELARLYEEFGDKQAAKQNLEQSLAIDPTSYRSSRAWGALAKLKEDQGDYSQALANYQRSHLLNSFQPAVAQRIAMLQRSQAGFPGVTPPGGTRLVETPMSPIRY